MENETAHTPGEWKVSDTSIVAGEFCIAVVNDRDEYAPPRLEAKANARLIAAAPDLLAACKHNLFDMERMTEVWGDEGFTRTARERLERAIAKAEGREVKP